VLGKLAEFLMLGMTPLLVGMMAVPTLATADETLVTGEVVYQGAHRLACDMRCSTVQPDADVSLADAPADDPRRAEDRCRRGRCRSGSTIRFDPHGRCKTNMTYALQARISVDDQLWFINDIRHALDPLTAGPQTIQVKMVRQSSTAEEVTIFDRDWVAEAIDGAAAHDKARPTLRIGKDGKVSGRGGCNGFFGSAKVDGQKLAFGQIGSTEMACEQAVMDQEHSFHQALERAASFRIVEGKLVLADKDGKDILRFAAAS
jgi:putative lipoprotein